MKAFFLSFIVALAAVGSVVAQGDLATDRPSESAAATLVPVGFGRAEIGGQLTWFTLDTGEPGFTYAAPLGVLRYGVKDWLEFRAGAQFAQTLGEVDNAMLGAKLALPGEFWGDLDACWLVELGISPGASWAPGQGVPMAHRFCFGRSVGQLGSLTGNLGWSRAAGVSRWLGSLVLGRELGNQGWTGFVEPVISSDLGGQVNVVFQRVVDDAWHMDVVYGRDFQTGDVRFGLGVSFSLAQPE